MQENWMHLKNENKDSLEELWHISENYKDNYQPDVEKGLVCVKSKIAQDNTLSASAKVVDIKRRQWIGRIAAAIIFLLTCGFLFNLFIDTTPELQQIATTDTLMENVVLPDGSTVWVNKNSKLTFPKSFEGNKRIVQLEGEAFFKVAKNKAQPFIVQTADGEVRAVGTAFNVRAHTEEAIATVEVEEGIVVFRIEQTKQERTLKANHKVIYYKAEATLSEIQSLDWKDTAWKATKLRFEDEPIKNVIGYLVNNFEVKIDFDKEKIGSCLLNVTLVDNQLESILKQIDSAFPLVKLKKVHSNLYELSGSCD